MLGWDPSRVQHMEAAFDAVWIADSMLKSDDAIPAATYPIKVSPAAVVSTALILGAGK